MQFFSSVHSLDTLSRVPSHPLCVITLRSLATSLRNLVINALFDEGKENIGLKFLFFSSEHLINLRRLFVASSLLKGFISTFYWLKVDAKTGAGNSNTYIDDFIVT